MKRTVECVLGIVGMFSFGVGTILIFFAHVGNGTDHYVMSLTSFGTVTATGIMAVVILNKYPKVSAAIFLISAIAYAFLVGDWVVLMLSTVPVTLYVITGILLIINEENRECYKHCPCCGKVHDSSC